MNELPILYTFWQSSCAWRVRIALAYKQIEYESREIDLYANKQWDDKFAAVNPVNFVPVFIHNGKCVTESMAILEYLEEAFPDKPKLLPDDLFERSLVRSLALQIISGIQPLQNERATSYYAPNDRKKQIEMSNYFINLGFQSLEKRLQKSAGRYAVGDRLSFADICIVPQVYNGVVAYGGVQIDSYPTIKHVFDEAIKLDAFLDSHPYRQSGILSADELKDKGFLLENWPARRSQYTEGHIYLIVVE